MTLLPRGSRTRIVRMCTWDEVLEAFDDAQYRWGGLAWPDRFDTAHVCFAGFMDKYATTLADQAFALIEAEWRLSRYPGASQLRQFPADALEAFDIIHTAQQEIAGWVREQLRPGE